AKIFLHPLGCSGLVIRFPKLGIPVTKTGLFPIRSRLVFATSSIIKVQFIAPKSSVLVIKSLRARDVHRQRFGSKSARKASSLPYYCPRRIRKNTTQRRSSKA